MLRKVQFQTKSRLDNLVDELFEEFKDDYYPKEEVIVSTKATERAPGLVRDKTAFGPRRLSDGTMAVPGKRYSVILKDSEEEVDVTDDQISRDRGIFTKAILRSFLKRTIQRDAWNGAPWLVKPEYAEQYHIDSRIPPHLRYDTKLQERKMLQLQKKAQSQGRDSPHDPNGPMRLPELKPAPKSHKAKNGLLNGTGAHSYEHREPSLPPPPPPPKYPIEDLLLKPQHTHQGTPKTRPFVKAMCRESSRQCENPEMPKERYIDQINKNAVGPLLETWDTLNVYCEIFKLDSFTFDDFVEAMVVTSTDTPVQLIDEIHCSVLKILVDGSSEGGRVRITLPELTEEEESEEEDEEEDEKAENAQEESEGASAEPEDRPPARATRSSLAKMEAQKLKADLAEEAIRAEFESKPRAEELLQDFDWIEQLRRREFADGGWQTIMVGLFHQLSKSERQSALCEKLLFQLVPPEIEPTPQTVQDAYASLDVNSRAQALQTLCMLTMETKAVRAYMEECSDTMTRYRKDKIDWQRKKKQA